MHIPDGMLPAEVCIAGYAGTAFLTWLSVKKAKNSSEDSARVVSRASVMAAAFFVASWIHIPIPPVSVHPILAGLMGILLGWISFPAILVGLFFQAAMFGHGGFTTLGINALSMGGAALIAGAVYRLMRGKHKENMSLVPGFVAGFTGVSLAVVFTGSILILTIPEHIDTGIELSGILAMAIAHIPIALTEGVFTALVARFLLKVKPDMLV
ncbi:MAG: cobalt transporter CbiM [Candidatus Fermentibacteria bacterium]|nr:cobalt transporter CbiM [Candidatus Fermentibacteria bacterium]